MPPTLTNAERCRLYRQRKRARLMDPESRTPNRPPPLTNADKCRRYRQRLQARSLETVQDSPASEPSNPPPNSITPRPNWKPAMDYFEETFRSNPFGYECSVCDRLWFLKDLRPVTATQAAVLEPAFGSIEPETFKVCNTCFVSISKYHKVPQLSKTNGFTYPPKPAHLPKLDPIAIRLISPRIPFMSLRRLVRDGGLGIVGQVINIPVDVDNMVNQLPRELDDDYAINVSLKRKLFHKSSYLKGYVKKAELKVWLQYLVEQPLYQYYNIQVNWPSLEDEATVADLHAPLPDHDAEPNDDLIDNMDSLEYENAPIVTRQHTLMWNEDQLLDIAPGDRSRPLSIVFDSYAEELSFPNIYYGQARKFNPQTRVTPFMMATSEIRRRDRRGATPEHILYMAMKILRLRFVDNIHSTFKRVAQTEGITRRMLEDKNFLEECLIKNLAFLRSLPNSSQYWMARKNDLFAMIRQLGKPTVFLTLSANEVNWPDLVLTLHRLSDQFQDINVTDIMVELNKSMRSSLVNEDPVTCCVYFFKLVDVIMTMLRARRAYNPFGRYYVVDSFERYEFQHRGSPHVHILLWLANDPKELVSENMPATLTMVNDIMSVSRNDVDDNYYANQVHRHTFTCTKRGEKTCRFGIPYWPIKQTCVLLPLAMDHGRRSSYKRQATKIKKVLDEMRFESFEQFMTTISIVDYNEYLNVIRSTIKRPTLLFKRNMSELMTNTFNPIIATLLNSNMDLQFIVDEYSCANYVADYINKSNRGISNLHRKIIELVADNPELSRDALLRKLSAKVLNGVEMSAQEAAWYLMRQNMSHASRQVVYIPTCLPSQRNRSHKSKADLRAVQLDSTDVWTKNIIQKYEERPRNLDGFCLADFVATKKIKRIPDPLDDAETHSYNNRRELSVIRYCNYEPSDVDNFTREMVLLFIPFRNEHVEVLDRNRYIETYANNIELIARKRSQYEVVPNLHLLIDELMKAKAAQYQELEDESTYRSGQQARIEFTQSVLFDGEEEDFTDLERRPNNNDQVCPVVSAVRQRDSILSKDEYCQQMRTTNTRQRELILEVLYRLNTPNEKPIQIFFTGPAGSGKTYVLKLIMETYNRYCREPNENGNSYLACASTGKAAVNLNGVTVHSAFHLVPSRRAGAASRETIHRFRNNFRIVKCVIIDEVSMIGSSLLHEVDLRLKQVTGDLQAPFGGMPIIFCGDFRQLPPVKANPVYKNNGTHIQGNQLWQSLDYYPLIEVMRQDDIMFSSILTKIGNGCPLSDDESKLIESRFRTEAWCDANLPGTIRLFHTNDKVQSYNNRILDGSYRRLAQDVVSGHATRDQHNRAIEKFNRLSTVETGCLCYDLNLKPGYPYMITTNIDVDDGLVNGAIGILKHFYEIAPPVIDENNNDNDYNNNNNNINDFNNNNNDINQVLTQQQQSNTDDNNRRPIIVWLHFDTNERVGLNARHKFRSTTSNSLFRPPNNQQIDPMWTPILERSASVNLGGTVRCRRTQLPLIPACAITIHKSQGGTFSSAVVSYDSSQINQLVYVGMSRVQSIDGLYLINDNNNFNFDHKKGRSSPTITEIRDEYQRLAQHPLDTLSGRINKFIGDEPDSLIVCTINAQSLVAHAKDIESDSITCKSDILAITETWMLDNVPVSIENYDLVGCVNERCVGGHQQGGNGSRQAGGVAIYIKSTSRRARCRSSNVRTITHNIGSMVCLDIETADDEMASNKWTIFVIYLHPHSTKTQITDFIQSNFRDFNQPGHNNSRLLVTGDFNTNIDDDDWLLNMMESDFNLKHVPSGGTTTLGNTTIDLTFAKNLLVAGMSYVSYYSYHKPLVNRVKFGNTDLPH